MNKKTATMVLLTGLTLGTIHAYNRLQYSLLTAKEYLSGTDNQYFEWRFGKIRYSKKGTGTPLLLIHDLELGSSSYEFHNIIGSLAKRHEVSTLDLLGCGLSDKPKITYTNFMIIQLITDFVKTIIGRKTDVVASGASAPIAIMTCHNNPELFRNIILINPQNIYELNEIPSKQTKALKLLIETPIIGTFVYNMLTRKAEFINRFCKDYYCDPSKIEEQDLEVYMESSHRNDYHSKNLFSSILGRYLNCNIIHPLKEINNNIVILSGEKYKDAQTTAENYCYYNHSIEMITIQESKKYPHMENPEEFLQTISIYL